MPSPATPAPSVTCSALGFAWPGGARVFDGLSLRTGPGRTGLVGANGTGKSTLLQLLAGQLQPSGGSVTVTGRLGYLPQDITLDTALRTDQALGIAARRAALHAIEAGDARDEHFETIGDDWDVEERALATLGSLGLGEAGLDRTVGQLSGGETHLLALAALLLQHPDVLLLDEPTNNLDLFGRQRLTAAVEAWHSGVLIVVSHDRDLLEHVDRIAELHSGTLTWYGGGWSGYAGALATQPEAAGRALRTAAAEERREQRELRTTQTRLARRQRSGARTAAQGGIPRAVAGARQRSAQESAGRIEGVHAGRLAAAREGREQAAEAVRDDAEIRVDLPQTAVPAGRTVLRLARLCPRFGPLQEVSLELRGPERVALAGRNGAGKTALLRTITGELPPRSGEATAFVPLRFLPQRLDVLDGAASVAANVARLAPGVTGNQIRAQLARFLFRGSRADQLAGTLSGGERFRATLAALLLATPAPQLLILDEPTNSLDLASVRQLTSALASYQGALLIASHDLPFLEAAGITRWLIAGDGLRETTAEELREPAGWRPDGPAFS